MLAIHDPLLTVFPDAGRWLKQKRVSGSWRRFTLFASFIAPVSLKSKRNFDHDGDFCPGPKHKTSQLDKAYGSLVICGG
jgi:hypothetical protein